MAFSYVTGLYSVLGASASSISLSSALNVASGDLLVGWVAWEDTSASISSLTDGGSNSLTMESVSNDTKNYAAFGYKLSASANSSATFTVTWSTNVPVRHLFVMQFRPDSGDTVSKDALAVGNGSGSSYQSGNINTTGTDEVLIGAQKSYNSGTFANYQIGDAGGDGYLSDIVFGLCAMWYRIVSATASGIHSQCTRANTTWLCHVISFKSEAPAGGVPMNDPFNRPFAGPFGRAI